MQPVRDAANEVRAQEAKETKQRGGVRLEPVNGLGDVYDFYRCYMCHRLITMLEERAALKAQKEQICKCGSSRYQPTQFVWYYLFLPRVFKFAILRILGYA